MKIQYKEFVVKYRVKKVIINFCECTITIYRWRKSTGRCKICSKEMHDTYVSSKFARRLVRHIFCLK